MRLRAIIALIIIICLIGGGVLYLINRTGFRVVSRDPAGNVALSITQISFTLSDDIINPTSAKLSISPEIEGEFSVSGKVVVFKPKVSLKENTTYKVSFDNITTSSSAKPQHTSTTFIAKYVAFSDLSKEEQRRQQDRTNPLYQKFPITKSVLPHIDTLYKIEYTQPLENATKLSITITPLISIGSHETTDDYHQRLLDIRNEALDYITKNGYKTDDLLIYYSDSFLHQFNATQDGEEFLPPINP